MDIIWLEMAEVRRRKLDTAVWIPLRAVQTLLKNVPYGFEGHREEFFGAASLAVPLEKREAAEELGWGDVGIAHSHHPYVEKGEYVPVDVERHRGGVVGIRLVFEQRGNHEEAAEWHLNPDLVVGLGLKREKDEWVAIHEGYQTAARLTRLDSRPALLEIRAEYLKDYLCARGMALLVSSFRQRRVVVANVDWVTWRGGRKSDTTYAQRWEGSVAEIHEGGTPFGAKTAVFHMSRTDVDPGDDVPTLGPPDDANVHSENWTREDEGRKLYVVRGALWRTEWVEPGASSPRVREDEVLSSVAFIVDASGVTRRADDLKDGEGWLWFRPDVIPSLLSRRGALLSWYTLDTGAVRCSPDYDVHFGVNALGLVTVWGADIARLPEWQQRIWVGSNIGPEGGVSAELLASQVRAEPANTVAPEAYLPVVLDALNRAGERVCGKPILREHEQTGEILRRAHRFRSLDDAGLLSLAKDLARIVADGVDAGVLHQRVQKAKEKKLGSLKSLEALVAEQIGDDQARQLLGPLFGIYDLRLADAHLPGNLADARKLLAINPVSPHVTQGRDMLYVCVSTLHYILQVLADLPPAA